MIKLSLIKIHFQNFWIFLINRVLLSHIHTTSSDYGGSQSHRLFNNEANAQPTHQHFPQTSLISKSDFFRPNKKPRFV